MGNMTLSIPEEMHGKMRHFSEVKWSHVAREAIKDRLDALQLAESIAKKSRLTEKDIREFSKKIKSSAAKRFLA